MKKRFLLTAGTIALVASFIVVALRNTDSQPEERSRSVPKAVVDSPVRSERETSRLENPLPVGVKIPSRDQVEGQPALVAPQSSELVTDETPNLADRIGSPHTPPEQEAKVVLDLLKLYRRLLGAYPAGENNSQFVNALLGANKQKLPLLPRDHPRLNANGELIDAWGTPFFFHQNSRNSVEVRSAGADHLLYTDDDIVAGKRPPPPQFADSAEGSPDR